MKDRNNVEIRTGDIVSVEGTYHHSDSGVYVVARSPGDPCWVKDCHSLYRVVRGGRISTAPDSVTTWPVKAYVSSPTIRKEADEWNRDNAVISVIAPLKNMSHIEKYFIEEANSAKRQARRMEAKGMINCNEVNQVRKSEAFFREVACRVSGKPNVSDGRTKGREYKYGMRFRGFSMGTAPTENLKSARDTDKAVTGFWSILIYSSPLTDEQIRSYELTPINC